MCINPINGRMQFGQRWASGALSLSRHGWGKGGTWWGTGGGAGGHAVTVQARNIQTVWYEIADLAQEAAEEWTELHGSIFR